jgi:hypothetical protein
VPALLVMVVPVATNWLVNQAGLFETEWSYSTYTTEGALTVTERKFLGGQRSGRFSCEKLV